MNIEHNMVKAAIIFSLLGITLGSLSFEFLNNLPEIDHIRFTTLSLDLELDDEILENSAEFSQSANFKLEFLQNDSCVENSLKVTRDIRLVSLNWTTYIKDPCITYLVLLHAYQNIEELLLKPLKNQPFIFAMRPKLNENEVWDLYELQFYSRRSVHLSTWSKNTMKNVSPISLDERRGNFNGAPVRLVKREGRQGDVRLQYNNEMLTILQKKYNFSLIKVPFEGFGTRHPDGSWTGAVRQIVDNEIDIAPLWATINEERLKLIQPGFHIEEDMTGFVYNNQLQKELEWYTVFLVFDTPVCILIGVTVVLLSFLLAMTSLKHFPEQFLNAFFFTVSTFFGLPFPDYSLTRYGHKWTKRIQILSMTLLGAFLFWCFNGVLTSLLAIQTSEIPLKALDDLKRREDVSLLVSKQQDNIMSHIYKWSQMSQENKITFQKRIKMLENEKKAVEELARYQDQRFLLIVTNLQLPSRYPLFKTNGLDFCNYEFARLQDFGVSSVAWMYPKNSILKPLFEKDFLESGERGISFRNRKPREMGSCNSPHLIQVSFNFVAIFFGILGVGLLISSLVFVKEIVTPRLH